MPQIIIVITLAPPVLVSYFIFKWAQRQNWTNMPNLNGMIGVIAVICFWLLLAYAYVAITIGFHDPWKELPVGVFIVGLGITALSVVAFLIYCIGKVFSWLTIPRGRY